MFWLDMLGPLEDLFQIFSYRPQENGPFFLFNFHLATHVQPEMFPYGRRDSYLQAPANRHDHC